MGADADLRITERRSHDNQNTRGRWDRQTDVDDVVSSWPMLVYVLAKRFGLWAVVTIGLLYFLIGDVRGTETAMRDELRIHAQTSAWMELQACRNLAIMAGTRPELCDPPKDDGHR